MSVFSGREPGRANPIPVLTITANHRHEQLFSEAGGIRTPIVQYTNLIYSQAQQTVSVSSSLKAGKGTRPDFRKSVNHPFQPGGNAVFGPRAQDLIPIFQEAAKPHAADTNPTTPGR